MSEQRERVECPYDAVVFDNDGVIVEPTERDVLVDAVVETFREFDVDVDRSHAEWTVAAAAGPTAVVREEHDIDAAAFWRRREAKAVDAQCAAVRAGGKQVYDDVSALDLFDTPLGLVSNNQHATVEFLLDYHGLGGRFETAYGRHPTVTGAERRKPEPHYIETALDDIGTTNALYVGDSEKDIVAAQRAGIDAAFLRRDHVAGVDLSVSPTYEVPSLDALVGTLTERSKTGSD